ncbi:MAG: hypothetical protein QT05_C0048G0068 [archaeon GW2011_AR13]|nr:MAG: hypothetical protein QT05_C0048G0068 [archaeon GW2011_AR13]HIG94151.1 hypothetical protein [Nanoarchaeota archaeon]HIH63920.1 hypothetical protein [Nanoarchaeota archaeon]HIJ09738.1 hypothetical protein [Nanoarchaeota archaeon]
MKYQNIKNQEEDKQTSGYSIASALSNMMNISRLELFVKPSLTPPSSKELHGFNLFEDAIKHRDNSKKEIQ